MSNAIDVYTNKTDFYGNRNGYFNHKSEAIASEDYPVINSFPKGSCVRIYNAVYIAKTLQHRYFCGSYIPFGEIVADCSDIPCEWEAIPE